MKASQESSPMPPPYSVAPPGHTAAPYPTQPGHPMPAGSVGPGYPPPPAPGEPVSNVGVGYPSQSAVVAGGVVMLPPMTVGAESCTIVCPSCRKTVQTEVKVVTTTRTHMFALLLAIFGCCLCCCIPYCVDSLKAKHHYCPECKAFIAAYER